MLKEIEQLGAAGFLLGRVELEVVIIDDETCGRIGLPRCVEGEVDVIRPELLEKNSVAKTVRPPVLGLDRFVDDVPAVNHAAIAANHCLNVLDHRALQLRTRVQLEVPTRGAVMPKEIVSAQGEAVLKRESGDRVGRSVVVVATCTPVHN